jgi:hypothetical protein
MTGKSGALSIGVANVAQLVSWTITQSADTVEASYMGQDWKCVKPGMFSWEGSAEAVFDTTATYPTIGAPVAIIAYESGSETGGTLVSTYSGDAIITSIETSAGVEDMITVSLSFVGDGTLTTA